MGARAPRIQCVRASAGNVLRLAARPSASGAPPPPTPPPSRHRHRRECGDTSAARDAATLPVRLRTAAAVARAGNADGFSAGTHLPPLNYRVYDIPV